MPSVFGANNRCYNPASDIRVVSSEEHFDAIRNDIDEKCRARRAVLVFFENITELTKFFDSPSCELFRKDGNYQIIAENVAPIDREMRIKRSGTEGMVTLLTANFGRGTDFVCRNPQLLSNGGVHVLQTFYSKEKSEEYQIMGRGARQGDRGSYAMILVDQDLEWLLGPDFLRVIEDAKLAGSHIHTILEDKRENAYNTLCKAKQLGIKQRRDEHRISVEFMKNIQERRFQPILEFLKNCNKSNMDIQASRTILLMDATGSMSNCLNAAKETVCLMFERASSILQAAGFDPNCFQMKFVVYRNYSSFSSNSLLEYSDWESNPARLREFMSRIKPSGGQGNEAIEAGLAYAVDQLDESRIDQIILIGDMPPNTREEVRSRRSNDAPKCTEWYWETELAKLQGVPVHCFYVSSSAENAFREISRRQSGRCEALDINGPAGAEMLTGLVTEEVLRKAGGNKGDQLVAEYQKRHSRAYLS